jgi:methionyl-tRNA formyltransferase
VRIAFFGTPTPAVPALEALLADPRIDVPLVVTNPDRPQRRLFHRW